LSVMSCKPDVILVTSLFEGYNDYAVTTTNFDDYATPIGIILYDLIPLIRQEQYLKDISYKSFYFNKIQELKNVNFLLPISNHAKQEAKEYLNLPEDTKIYSISCACDKDFIKKDLSIEQINGIFEKFNLNKSKQIIMYTGGADSRKNITSLIEAFSYLIKDIEYNNYQLIIIGKIAENEIKNLLNYAQKCNLPNNNISFLGYISQEELVFLYNISSLFVFPSLHEGFGIPPLEAMSCGCPVISSNASSLPEVIGNNEDMLFNPLSIDDILTKMKNILNSKQKWEQISNYGISRSKNFSWTNSAILLKNSIDNYFKNNKKQQNDSKYQDIIINNLSRICIINNINNDNYIKQIAINIDLSTFNIHRKPKIFIDISHLAHLDFQTGIQRVVRSLIEHIIKVDYLISIYDIHLVCASPTQSGIFYADNFRITKDFNTKINYRCGDIFIGLDLNHDVLHQKAILDDMFMRGVIIYFLVYDLLPIKYAQYFDSISQNLHTNWLSLITLYNGVIAISQTVAEEIKEWIYQNDKCKNLNRLKIKHFHLGADIDNSVPSKGYLPENEIFIQNISNKINFLIVGTVEPRKGHIQTLEAFNLLWNNNIDVNLIIVGKKGWKMDNFVHTVENHSKYNINLFWLNGISDEFLEIVYTNTTCLISASEGEGFGLPLIEAAHKKIPIIARNIPVFKEVAGEYAYYFDGLEPNNLANAITNWISLYQQNNHPKSDNMPWLTWEESTKQLLDIIL
ncbi:MAG: hypothetical protein RLZZ210_339, partial [Pseudomonadota bacterium]